MDATTWTFRAAACIGKETFATPQLASKVQRRRAKGRGTYKVKQHVYRCKACGQFHIGTARKSVHASAKRATAREKEVEVDMI